MIDNLSTEQLRSFVTIVETGSFSLAAERLHRTQPALSLQIKRLEEQIGSRVLDRTGRSATLTEAGRVLHRYARKILDLNEEALAKLTMADATGTVRVGVLEEVAHGRLLRLLTRFSRLATGIRIQLDVSTSWELVRRIQSNELDLAIANTAYSSLESTVLWEEAYVWAQSSEADFSEVLRLPMIIDPLESPCVGCLEARDILDREGIDFEVVFSTTSLLATQAAIRAGLGIGMIAESALSDDMVVLGADQGLPPLSLARIGLYRANEAAGAATASLCEFLVDHLRQAEIADVA